MSYASLSDDLLLRLEHAGVSRDARLLYVEALVHCSTVPTDGDIRVRLSRITDAADPDSTALELVMAGLWKVEDAGYRIVHYLRSEGGHQRSREQILRDQESNRRRQENYRRTVAENKEKRRNGATDAVTNGGSNGVSNAALPTPPHPTPKGYGVGEDRESAGISIHAFAPDCCALPEANRIHHLTRTLEGANHV